MNTDMTEKIFYENPHQTKFDATVISCTPAEDGKFLIVLDRTAFFPEEGGQNADSGYICKADASDSASLSNLSENAANAFPVLDVQIQKDVIYHKLAAAFTPGEQVRGCVDWDKRFDYMQQHSGEHLISGLVNRRLGYHNVGFHLGDEEVTLDFDGVLTLEELREIEAEANRAITLNIPVHIYFPSKEELAVLEYRSKIEIEGAVRIVEFPGFDVCACCAPHVDTTGQIGLIKVTNVMKHRGGVRVNILCGSRALADYTGKQDSVSSISVQLSAKPDAVAGAVARLKEENLKQKTRMIALQQQLLQLQLAAIPAEQENVFLFFEDLDTPAMREAVNTLCETHIGYCAVFTGNDSDGYQYILGSLHQNCKEASALLAEKFGARGGGSERMVQGSVKALRAEISGAF